VERRGGESACGRLPYPITSLFECVILFYTNDERNACVFFHTSQRLSSTLVNASRSHDIEMDRLRRSMAVCAPRPWKVWNGCRAISR